jgi:ribosome-associated protein
MDIKKLQRAIVDGLEDVKAQHIAVFNTEHLSSMFERVIIATGTSNRQTKSLAASVRDAVRKRGMPVLSTEGEDNGEWIIVDCGAAVAHIMQPAIREYYHLEEIWGGKSVRMKVGEVSTRLVKASEPEPVVKTAAAKKAPAKKVVAKKAANKSAAYKRVAAKAPARKAAPAGKTVLRKAPARKAPRPG